MIDLKEYDKALRIVNAYPQALKVIEQYNKENKTNTVQTHIDLRGVLSVRGCNVINNYAKEYIKDSSYEIHYFPIEIFFKIDMFKLKKFKQCGKRTFMEMGEFIAECKIKYGYLNNII